MISGFLLAAVLQFTPADAHLAWDTARSLVEECTPRDAGTIRGRVAANHLLDKASATGADVRQDAFKAHTPQGEREFTNLYAELRGADTNARWVVVLSHYDTKPGVKCPGANDGAATSGLLVALANVAVDCRKLGGNLLLVWTDGEECVQSYDGNDGLQGSKRAVEYIKERGYQVQAAICLDMLGDKELSISIPANGNNTLAKIAAHAARRIGEPQLVHPITEHVKDDHVPFLDAGMKAIDLIDFSYGPANKWWHTPDDTMDKISEASLLKSGRLVTEIINILL